MKLLESEASAQWKTIGLKHRHGIALPLFSLHTEQSCGIGEYLDLIPLIDWCVEVGMDVIQLLPLNDTGIDSSPYSAISAFALNPLFLRLEGAPKLPMGPRVDYPAVREAKYTLLKSRPFDTSNPDYQAFCEENPWLDDYALFKALWERYHHALWSDWPQTERPPEGEIEFHKVVQFLCHQQMRKVKLYADKKGVLLMGDLPILVALNSHDVWKHSSYFDYDYAAGAPPDYYNSEGQAWGLPCYHWEPQEKEGFRWWKQRLARLTPYFHLYRIDHIIGFFRLWAIPVGEPAKAGHYIPSTFEKWFEIGMKLMHVMIKYSPLLPIGEDLGDIPEEVRRALSHLGICGTKVIRWEREGIHKDGPYIPIDHYPVDSLTTVSTHDSEPLQFWWEAYPDESKAFCDYLDWTWQPSLSHQHLEQILSYSHHSPSLFHINPLQEYFALAGLTRGDIRAERINTPGTVSDANWSHRFLPTVEQMLEHKELKTLVKKILPVVT